MSNKGFPINQENLDRMADWSRSVSEQAHRALEVAGPQIEAALATMVHKMRGGQS